MSAFSPDSVPSRQESEGRASHAQQQRLERRHLWWLLVKCAAAGALLIAGVIVWLNGGDLA